MSGTNLVITGHLGFIGCNFLKVLLRHKDDPDFLLNRYENLILIDRDSLGRNNQIFTKDLVLELNHIIKTTEFLFDINDLTNSEFDDFDGGFDILNFASESHVDDSIKSPFYIYTSNTKIAPNLIESIGFKNIDNFWHIRTDEEFGHLESPDDKPFSKSSPINPRNPYSASKSSQTLFLDSLSKTFKFPVGYFCLSNQYGLYQHNSKMIPATIKRICSGQSAKIYGEGRQMREWTFVENTVQKIYYTLCYNSKFYHIKRTLFISDSQGLLTNLNLVKLILYRLYETKGVDGMFRFVEDRKGHDFCYKLKSDFKFDEAITTVPPDGIFVDKLIKVRSSLIDTFDHYIQQYI